VVEEQLNGLRDSGKEGVELLWPIARVFQETVRDFYQSIDGVIEATVEPFNWGMVEKWGDEVSSFF
jgi:hypothetical protein